MFHCTCKKNEYLFKQGDYADAFFLINSGKVAVEINENVKKTLEKGNGVGELALLYSAPRSASIKCLTDMEFWGIQRQEFKILMEEIIKKEFQATRKFMEQAQFFSQMSESQKDAIAQAVIPQKFKKDEIIVTEGEPSNSFFLIKEGFVSIWKGKTKLGDLNKGDSFGEQSLYVKNAVIQATVRTEDDRNVLFEQGDFCDCIFAVLEGRICTENGRCLAEQRQIFGEQFLQDDNIKFQERILVWEDSILAVISFKLFYKIIGGSFNNVVQKNLKSHEVQMKKLLANNPILSTDKKEIWDRVI
ncbi:hypothetical protein IMG5_157930 [Ichthyophthirius multifiliis]|uniref:Cyclic nucleotide-binding domain-containing protein n=1 Tax=Ichthyophthirius multifiliis TaxID=5932 RepID=G0QZL4_ICHMU|nr:hypothetical protein IMG5_157930 [Ichthyophthirius multifiliis]EGR29341.1 hypothetical protein IMG5_157930 [Ichthyophthirius multifiliis]|eukprot:XP_004030577.1 hypothetical protein IMG5_157930 [Ichthyophthirius multifiliis]